MIDARWAMIDGRGVTDNYIRYSGPFPRASIRDPRSTYCLRIRLRNISQARTFRPVKPAGDGSNREIGEGYALLSVGITFALTLVGFTLGGFWLDGRMKSLPLFTVLGMLVGAGLGGFWLWQRFGKRPRGPHDTPQ